MDNTNDQTIVRKEKLKNLSEKGVDTYPASYENRMQAELALKVDEGERVRVAGRIMSRRLMGKASFAHLQDDSGKIQIYIKKDLVGEEKFSLYKTELDIGDFIGAEGQMFTTRTGEKTLQVSDFTFLSKSLRPLPEKWHGLRDIELRYRKRYLDLIVNEESTAILKGRSKIIASVRRLLEERGYTEVETPILQDIFGGAAARPFITHHNLYNIDLYMRIAPELYLKRLLVGGWERVYEIGRNFRNEGLSKKHNPEFTMLEVYCAYTDYKYMMELSKEIVLSAHNELKKEFTPEIDLTKGWQEKNLWDLISEYSGLSFDPDDSIEELRKKADALKVPSGKDSAAKIIDRVFSAFVEEKLIQPTFVTGYLAKDSPLAKSSSKDLRFAERFELFIGGQEIGNSYSEQNDPEIQRKMFELQVQSSDDGEFSDKIDTDYLEALEHGMPPASGLGIGIDRLAMQVTGASSIREVILFPMLKPSA